MKPIKTVLLAFTLILSISCDKYLDIKSQNGYVTPNTIENLQSLMDDNYTMNMRFPDISVASSDDFFYPDANYNSLNERNRKIYTWEYNEVVFNNDWAKAYSTIYQANLALDEIIKITPTPSQTIAWNNVKGSAHFFRAYQNLLLVWTYANAYTEKSASTDLGIVLRQTSNPNVPSTRSTLEECYRHIISDLNLAISYLPTNSTHPMRPSKTAAYATLARVYLNMHDFKKAYNYVDSALTHYNSLMDFNNSTEVKINTNLPFPSFNKEIIFYGESSNGNSLISPNNFFVDTLLYKSYAANDLRKMAFFNNSQAYQKFKGAYSASGQITFLGITTPELYLIKSECYARNGDVVNSMKTLNSLLSNRYNKESFVPIIAKDADQALQIILNERRKELAFKGLRWSDIKRLNVANGNISLIRNIAGNQVVLAPNHKRFALQIPKDIIEITGIPQNEF